MNPQVFEYLEKFPQDKEAVGFMMKMHNGDTRHNGDPYYLHPIAVAINMHNVCMLSNEPYTDEIRRAALLHDVMEDHPERTSWDELSSKYSDWVTYWIKPITKVKPNDWKDLTHHGRMYWTISHYSDLQQAPHQSRLIKVADRICNLKDMETSKLSFRINYLTDTTLLIATLQGHVHQSVIDLLAMTFWEASKKVVAAA